MVVIEGLGLLPTGDTLIYLLDTSTSDLIRPLLGIRTSFPQFTWIPSNESDQIRSQHISCPGGRAAGQGAKTLLAVQREFLRRRSRGDEKDLRKEEREAKEIGAGGSYAEKIHGEAEHSENMSLWFWISLWASFGAVFWNAAAQSPSYTLQHSQATFDEAAAACSPGHLTTVLNKHELAHVLDLIPEAEPPLIRGSFTFWVGLRKAKPECVVPGLPLRGFKWTAGGSEETQVSQWAVEPELTCTAVQCAALKAQVDSSNVTDWGLIPVRCETKHRFICKHNDSRTPRPPKPTAPNLVPTSAGPEPRRSTRTPDTQTSEGEAGSTPGSEKDRGSNSCGHLDLSTARSLIPHTKDHSRIQVECWTAGMQVEIRCSGQPALWRLLDGSVANFTSICVPCDDGFRKNSSGKCEDIDECREKSAPCRNTCQNTPGSYRCVCTDETGEVVSEDSLTCNDTAGTADKRLDSGLLVPVLVAVVGLVVLVILFAVMVKCCVMRRSKRRAVKKAEKMSMSSKDEKKPAV